MQGNVIALVVSSHPEQVASLVTGLERLAVTVKLAGTVAEANLLLASPEPPRLIWSEVNLPDGSWRDLLARTRDSANPANVIVVSRQADVSLYVETINQGAFDFVVTPIALADLAYVFRGAVENALSRRDVELQSGTASTWKRNTSASAPSPEPPKEKIKKPRPQTLPPLAYHSATE